RETILQLVAETVGAARLIETGARPHAAGERLVEQPAIEQEIHRTVGCLDLDGAERFVPKGVHIREQGIEIGVAGARDEGLRLAAALRLAECDDDFGFGAGRQADFGLQHAAWIEPRTGAHRQRGVAHQRPRLFGRTIAPQEFATIRRRCSLAAFQIEESDAAVEILAPGILGEQRGGRLIDFGEDIGLRFRPAGTERPFGIGGDRDAAHAARTVDELQPRNLYRISERHELREFDADAARGMFETRIAVAVIGDIAHLRIAHRVGGWAPHFARVEIAQVYDLARLVGDGIVRPGGDLVLLTVGGP